jgi:hypothetical protein
LRSGDRGDAETTLSLRLRWQPKRLLLGEAYRETLSLVSWKREGRTQ